MVDQIAAFASFDVVVWYTSGMNLNAQEIALLRHCGGNDKVEAEKIALEIRKNVETIKTANPAMGSIAEKKYIDLLTKFQKHNQCFRLYSPGGGFKEELKSLVESIKQEAKRSEGIIQQHSAAQAAHAAAEKKVMIAAGVGGVLALIAVMATIAIIIFKKKAPAQPSLGGGAKEFRIVVG